ncbi:hypothetical protein K1719_012010 [Acacia pycnantha]|nr:hypothetical protein K1719_012010 [Acacia pycnantha]
MVYLTHLNLQHNWATSSQSIDESHSSGFTNASSHHDGLHGFRLPRQGPVIMLGDQYTENRRRRLQMCAFGFLLDRKVWSKRELQDDLDQVWKLQGRVTTVHGHTEFVPKNSAWGHNKVYVINLVPHATVGATSFRPFLG